MPARRRRPTPRTRRAPCSACEEDLVLSDVDLRIERNLAHRTDGLDVSHEHLVPAPLLCRHRPLPLEDPRSGPDPTSGLRSRPPTEPRSGGTRMIREHRCAIDGDHVREDRSRRHGDQQLRRGEHAIGHRVRALRCEAAGRGRGPRRTGIRVFYAIYLIAERACVLSGQSYRTIDQYE